MIDEKQFETLTREKKRLEKNILSKEEIEENIIEWTTFFRRNLDIFNTDYLEIELKFFQEQLIQSWNESDIHDTIASRGISKSFMVGILATDLALLYSNCYILITSFTLNQSNTIIDEKIDKIFTSEGKKGSSPLLIQLRKDKWIEFSKDTNTGGKIVEFGNGSKIFAVTCGDSARSKRSNVVITDECVLIKKKDYDEIIEPTLEKRNFIGRPDDYDDYEGTKQIFLSSARNKTNWMWRHLKESVNGYYKDKITKYGFFAGDIFTAVANKIQTKQLYLQRKKNTDDLSFMQEYLNIFLGSNDDGIFKFEDFEKNQILENPFYPRNVYDVLDKVENKYKFSDNEIRILVCDIAIATGDDNDNTVYLFMTINKDTGHKKVEYITTESGLNSVRQVLLMKRYYEEYRADYFVLDTKGVGNVIYDMLTEEIKDSEFGLTYSAWTVNTDKSLQLSSDIVIGDKISRTNSYNAKDVIIPFAGTSELNSNMHLTLRKTLRDGDISLLKDDTEMKAKIEDKDKTFFMKSEDEKSKTLLPFLQTKYMINEAISLETKFMDGGAIKLKEAKRTDVKDRYMTLAMANLFAEKIVNKYVKKEQQEINADDWKFLSGDFSDFQDNYLW